MVSGAAAAAGSTEASEPAGRAASSDVTPCACRPLAGLAAGSAAAASPRAALYADVTGACARAALGTLRSLGREQAAGRQPLPLPLSQYPHTPGCHPGHTPSGPDSHAPARLQGRRADAGRT